MCIRDSDEAAVAHDVELEPERMVVRGLGHVLDRADAHGRQRERDAEFLRCTGRQDFACLLYTSDAADERSSVDLGGRRIIKKKNQDG